MVSKIVFAKEVSILAGRLGFPSPAQLQPPCRPQTDLLSVFLAGSPEGPGKPASTGGIPPFFALGSRSGRVDIFPALCTASAIGTAPRLTCVLRRCSWWIKATLFGPGGTQQGGCMDVGTAHILLFEATAHIHMFEALPCLHWEIMSIRFPAPPLHFPAQHPDSPPVLGRFA